MYAVVVHNSLGIRFQGNHFFLQEKCVENIYTRSGRLQKVIGFVEVNYMRILMQDQIFT